MKNKPNKCENCGKKANFSCDNCSTLYCKKCAEMVEYVCQACIAQNIKKKKKI